jgi:hypothetical protein
MQAALRFALHSADFHVKMEMAMQEARRTLAMCQDF